MAITKAKVRKPPRLHTCDKQYHQNSLAVLMPKVISRTQRIGISHLTRVIILFKKKFQEIVLVSITELIS